METRPIECKNHVLCHVSGQERHYIKQDGSISGCHEGHKFFLEYGTYIHVKNAGTPRRVLQPPVTIIPRHHYWRVDGRLNAQGRWVATRRIHLKTEPTVFTLQYLGGKRKSLYKPVWCDNDLVNMAKKAFRNFRETDPLYRRVRTGESERWSGTFKETRQRHYVLSGRWRKMNDRDSIETFWIDSIEEFVYNNN